MQSKKETSEKENQKLVDSYDYLANAASSQDCTGLIPALPEEEAEIEFYEELYPYLPRPSGMEEEK